MPLRVLADIIRPLIGQKEPLCLSGEFLGVTFRDSFVCYPLYLVALRSVGIFISTDATKYREMRELAEKEPNKISSGPKNPAQYLFQHVISYRELEHSLGFEIITTFHGRVTFLCTNYPIKLKIKGMLCDFVNLQTEISKRQNSTQISVDPFNYLNDDAIFHILALLNSVSDLALLTLVSKTWKSRLGPIIIRVIDHLIQNQFLEHQRNFDFKNAHFRIKLNALYKSVSVFEFKDGILPVLHGGKFQTWKINTAVWSGKFYFEVEFGKTIKIPTQIGWMSVQCDCKPEGQQMSGVGDDSNSWSFDPTRSLVISNKEVTVYGTPEISKNSKSDLSFVSPDDVIGCLFDLKKSEISYSRNGQLLGVAFSGFISQPPYYPAVTKFKDANVTLKVSSSNMKYLPAGFAAVGDGIPQNGLLIEGVVGKYYLHNLGNNF